MNKNNKVSILCPSVPLNWEPLKGRTCIFCIFYQVQNSQCASQAECSYSCAPRFSAKPVLSHLLTLAVPRPGRSPGSENLFIILQVSAKSLFPLGKLQDFPHIRYRAPPECPTAPLILSILAPVTLLAPSVKRETSCNTRDLGLIPRSGRSPGEGNGYPLQYSCLGDPTDRGRLVGYRPWGHKSQTWRSD